MARMRFFCVYECTHGAYTWPRLAIERLTTPAAADAAPYPARHGYSARPSSREARDRRYRRAACRAIDDEDDCASRLGNDDATDDERASALFSHAWT
jgi:hypothetical protein